MSEIYTIGGMIDKVRESLKKTSDDNTYPDEYIYSVLLDHRNLLVYRDLNKKKKISKFLYKTICMPLELGSESPCDCLYEVCTEGCDTAMVSKYKVPKPIKLHNYELIHVMSINGVTEYTNYEPRWGRYRSLRRTNKTKPYYTIYNDYLFLLGAKKNIPALMIEIVLEDPLAAIDIPECDKDGNVVSDSCVDMRRDTFQLDGHLYTPLLEMTLKTLGISESVPQDLSNNAQSVAPEKII